MTSTFHNPVETYFGCSSFNQIDALTQNKSVVIVTFPQAHELGLIEKAQQLLGDRIIHIIDSVQPNPDVAELNEIYNKFWHEYAHCDVVVALGGGSTIDTAKALIVGTETKKFDQLLALLATGQNFEPAKIKSLIAVPTTAGTGSEVTPWATIWDSAQQKKYSLHLPCTWPTAAIIDPELMLTLPAEITISTGLDALSHALESIWNINANPISDTFAVSAIQEILTCLPQLSENLNDLELRSKMALAALKAGMAFSNTKTALAHSISYEMTLHYGIAHGIACSFTLPMVLGMAWGKNPQCDQTLQQVFGSDVVLAQQKLTQFLSGLGIKTEFQDYGLSTEQADQMVLFAMQGARGKNFIGV